MCVWQNKGFSLGNTWRLVNTVVFLAMSCNGYAIVIAVECHHDQMELGKIRKMYYEALFLFVLDGRVHPSNASCFKLSTGKRNI